MASRYFARGNRRGQFKPELHPRGSGGRFVETPDKPKPLRARRKRNSESQLINAKLTKRLVKSVEADIEVQNAKRDIYDSLKRDQRKRLTSVLAAKAKTVSAPPSTPVTSAETPTATPSKKKRTRLTPEEKASKEAEKQKEKAEREAAKEVAKEAAKEAAKEVAARLARSQMRANELAERKAAREAELAEKAQLKEEDKQLFETYKAKAKQQIQENIATGEADPYKLRIKRDPTSRPEPAKDSVSFTEAGVEIWKGKPEYAKFDAGFKVRQNKNYEYSVDHEGQNLVLNRSRKVYEYGGETVEGIPDTHHKLRDLEPKQLFSRLAEAMRHTENSKRGIAAPAPEWKPTIHGSIPKQFVRSKKGAGTYGEMQIHHVDQWAQKRFDDVTSQLKYNTRTKQYEDGSITLEEAKSQMRSLLTRVEKTDKKGNVKSEYEIAPKLQIDRRLVVLAAGTHDINSPLYFANHPRGIHPDTGKLEKFGIPEDGDSGREQFNAWRAGFWAQHYRREAYIYRQEINRRVKEGKIAIDEARDLWDNAHQGVVKNQQVVLELRKTRQIERKAVKEAITEAKAQQAST